LEPCTQDWQRFKVHYIYSAHNYTPTNTIGVWLVCWSASVLNSFHNLSSHLNETCYRRPLRSIDENDISYVKSDSGVPVLCLYIEIIFYKSIHTEKVCVLQFGFHGCLVISKLCTNVLYIPVTKRE